MSCQHDWYEISRDYSNTQLAWCKVCGTLKFTTHYEGERLGDITFHTPKNSKVAQNSTSTNKLKAKIAEMDMAVKCLALELPEAVWNDFYDKWLAVRQLSAVD